MGRAVDALKVQLGHGLDEDDMNLIVMLAKKGRLDWSPKSNWVEEQGGLPEGIESMAIHMMEESGLSRQHAIAAAVERAKKLAAKGKARWIKNVAQWEAMKARANAS